MRAPKLSLLSTALLSVAAAQTTINDECITSETLPAIPFSISLNSGAASKGKPSDTTCFSDGKRFWYVVSATNLCYMATWQSVDTSHSSTAQISLLSGACDNLQCARSDSSTFDEGASLLFRADADYYFVLEDGNPDGSSNWVATVRQVRCSAMCEYATEISAPATSRGNTLLTSRLFLHRDEPILACNGYTSKAPVQYFRTTGTGSCLRAKVDAAFDPLISVYTGTCASLTCLGGSYTVEEQSEGISNLVWMAETGVDYTITVGGVSDSEDGSYTLELEEVECPPIPQNGICTAATSLTKETTGLTTIMAPVAEPAILSLCPSTANQNARVAGLWYDFVGDGYCRVIRNQGGNLLTFTGGCNNLNCVEGISTSFRSVDGERYRLFVYDDAYRNRGPHALAVGFSSACESSRPRHDNCLTPVLVDSLPFYEEGELYNSTAEPGTSSFRDCNQFGPNHRPIWFEIQGTGSCIGVTVTSPSSTDFVVGVYAGDACSDMKCMGETSNGGDNASPTVSIPTISGVTYKIALAPRSTTSGGVYQLSVSESLNCPYSCSDSRPIFNLPQTVFGNTSQMGQLGWYDREARACVNGDRSSYIQYFSVLGTGGCLEAEIVSSLFEPSITLLSGDCVNLVCLDKSYDEAQSVIGFGFPLNQNRYLLWVSQPGVQYTLAIGGFNATQQGAFSMKLSDATCPTAASNNACLDADSIDMIAATASGSLITAPNIDSSLLSKCSSWSDLEADQVVGLWYKFVGDDLCKSVEVQPTLGREAKVFSGDCDQLTCIAETENDKFWANPGETYYIFVQGVRERGTFRVDIKTTTGCSTAPPANNVCGSAVAIQSLPSTQSGYLRHATIESSGSPAFNCPLLRAESKTLWYEVVGDGSCFSASTAGTSFDTIVGVYRADGGTCDNMQCIADNDDAPDTTTSRVYWETFPNVTYKVVVATYEADLTGSFELSVSRLDECPSGCSICYDGSLPEPNATFRGTKCSDLNGLLSTIEYNDEDCLSYQLIGLNYCGCPRIGEETCNICGSDDYVPTNLDASLSPNGGGAPYCRDFVNLPAMRGPGTCDHISVIVGDACGCIEGGCTLCPGNRAPTDENRVVPNIFGERITCGEWATRARQQNYLNCDSIEFETGFDIGAFCCSNLPPPRNCNFNCPTGIRPAPDSPFSEAACAEAQLAAPFLLQERCQSLNLISASCCSTETRSPTAAPLASSQQAPVRQTPTLQSSPVGQTPVGQSPVGQTPVAQEPTGQGPTDQVPTSSGGEQQQPTVNDQGTGNSPVVVASGNTQSSGDRNHCGFAIAGAMLVVSALLL